MQPHDADEADAADVNIKSTNIRLKLEKTQKYEHHGMDYKSCTRSYFLPLDFFL